MKLTRMLRGGNDNVPVPVAWHPCWLIDASRLAGWSGFDTIEPARWVGGTGAMSSGLEDGLDSESRQSFSNVMRECPIQVPEPREGAKDAR